MIPIALISLLSMIAISQSSVKCSPPVDYFVYTSQLTKNNNEDIETISPSLKSIYSPHTWTTNEDSRNASSQIDKLSERVLALVLNASHTHDNDLVDLDATRYAWHLMEKQALLYMRNRIKNLNPFIEGLLKDAQVSSECKTAITGWIDDLKDLKKWAAVMWNSWGDFPPAGVFEGSFTDLGSYRSCVGVADNPVIGQAQYCTLDFQPIVPTRPRFHSIFKKILDVEPETGRITGGDFPVDKISSSHSAHTFSSSRFRENVNHSDYNDQSITFKYLKRTISDNGTDNSDANLNITLKTEVSATRKSA